MRSNVIKGLHHELAYSFGNFVRFVLGAVVMLSYGAYLINKNSPSAAEYEVQFTPPMSPDSTVPSQTTASSAIATTQPSGRRFIGGVGIIEPVVKRFRSDRSLLESLRRFSSSQVNRSSKGHRCSFSMIERPVPTSRLLVRSWHRKKRGCWNCRARSLRSVQESMQPRQS